MINKFLKSVLVTFFLGATYTINVQAFTVNYIAGKTRFETAAMIADKLNYSTAVIVNGYSLADGLSASGLSGSINAPILLTERNYLPEATLKKIKNVNKVYLVGGEGVISLKVEKYLEKLGKKVIRLGGKNRIDTSIVVAEEIKKIKGINEIYYVNGLVGEADAMSIAPVAAKNANPIILTDGNSTTYRMNVKSYAIGGSGVLKSNFDFFAERIGGIDRFETNRLVIKKFFPDKIHVNLSKSHVLIDALTASALKEPVVLINSNSDKSIIAGAKSATVLGDIDDTAVKRAKSYIFNDTVVFYSQHQDDETIFAGSAIIDAIEAVGAKNVYIVLISDGDESGVFLGERYKNLTLSQKTELRNNEFIAATKELGVLEENLIFLNQSESSVFDKVVSNTILDLESKFTNVTHITHSYKYDLHEQHLKTGNILYNLYKSGLIKDCRFFGRKELIPTNNQKTLIESVSDNKTEKEKLLKAVDEYKLDNKDMVREGIGYKSVKTLFDILTNDPNNTSYLHEPGL